MKLLVFLSSAAVAVLLASCATSGGPAPGTPRYFQTLESMNIAPATLKRIEGGRVLRFGDVMDLVRHGVPGTEIVAYLKCTRAPYRFTQQQLDTLVAAGADSTLYNYLGRSLGDFMIDAQDAAKQDQLRRDAKWDKEVWNDPYFTDPGYWGPAPFPFAWPMGWY